MALMKKASKPAPRMSRNVGVAIRDDGMLYPALDAVLKQPNYRPYHGKLDATLEERLEYLQGFAQSDRAKVAAEVGTFNIATAEKEEIIDYILTEFGKQLDGRHTLPKLRSEAIALVKERDGE